VCSLPAGILLLQGLPKAALARAQASVQGSAGKECSTARGLGAGCFQEFGSTVASPSVCTQKKTAFLLPRVWQQLIPSQKQELVLSSSLSLSLCVDVAS